MNSEDLAIESSRLRAAWMQHDAEQLDRYLVTGIEDPRINLQSIITRAFLVDAIWPNEFTTLIQEEFRFGACLNGIMRILRTAKPPIRRQDLLQALADRQDMCGSVAIPAYLKQTFDLASRQDQGVLDYITQALMYPGSAENTWLPECALSTFEQLWSTVLSRREGDRISVLEPACGSANDYRFLHAFGIARFLDYTGIDICKKNIANARSRFPAVDFRAADFLSASIEDKSYDYLIVHDLFEHLSLPAMELALSEICRVTRKQACLSFFNMADAPDHEVKPKGLYHRNLLSTTRVRDCLMASARAVDTTHIATFLKDNYTCTDHHNDTAYTLMVYFD